MWSILLVTIFVIPVTLSYTFPEKLERCHLKDPNLDNCLKTSIQNALRIIGTSGIPSINLPPIEPMEAVSVVIGAGSSAVNLVQKYKDVKMYGYINAIVDKAQIYIYYDYIAPPLVKVQAEGEGKIMRQNILDMDKKELTFTTSMDEVSQKAHYEVDGKIMMLPLFGSGDSTITLYGAIIDHIIHFKEEIRKGKTYFEIVSYETRMSITKAHFDLQNLFNGDKLLADNVLKVINDNGAALFEDDKEAIQAAYAEIYKSLATRLFHNIPVDEIFLP